MRDEYDFSGGKPNPYSGQIKKPVTMNRDIANIEYFKAKASRTGVPYQTLINMYLTECREKERYLTFE